MGLISWLAGAERRSANISLAEWDLILQQTTSASATGRSVTPGTALGSVAVFACVTILTDTIASLPLPVYRRLAGGGKEKAPEHPLYNILHDQPNPEMTSMEFRETLVGHLALWGNAYAEIQWDPYTQDVLALWPLRPDHMSVGRRENGQLYYEYRMPDGRPKVFAKELILHLRLWGGDGLIGYSPISMARQAIGLTLAAEEYGARFFGNDSRPGGVLKHPGKLTPDGAKRLREGWELAHKGLTQSNRVAVLEEGVEWQQIGLPPEDAQFLQTRGFQTAEIARLFRIPPHMIADVERSTSWGTGIEQQSIGFAVYTILPWTTRIEQRMQMSLLDPAERRTYFVEHLITGLLRGDVKTRYDAYSIGRNNGWLNADEIREMENMNPIPDGAGQVYWQSMNVQEMGKEPSPPAPSPRVLGEGEQTEETEQDDEE